MSDNTRLPLGTEDGDIYASDEIAGVKIQRVKLVLGADGTNDGDVASGNPIPVSGTVTVGSHAVTNAGTFAVQATEADGANVTLGAKADAKNSATDTTAISLVSILKQISSYLGNALTVATHAVTQSGTWTVQPGNTANTTAWKVDASSVAVPVTDNSGSITVDNGGTFAVQASIAAAQTLANVTTLGTITNVVHVDDNSGNLSIDDGGNSITVDGSVTASIAAGATTIAKAEDVGSADADVGVPAMMVRKATPANTSGTDGDYEMLQGSAGRLWVDPSGVTLTVASHAVTNAGTFAVQAAEADGANVTLGAKADAKSTATDTTSISAMSVLKQISASVQAPPSQAVTNTGTFAVQATIASGATAIAKAEDVASGDADVGVPAMAIQKASPADTAGTDGDYAMLQMSGGRVWVDASGKTLTVASHAVTNAGTFAVQATCLDTPDATATYAPTNATSTVYATNLVVKASAGVMFSCTGYNSKTAAQFIQFHNATSLPADTAVPVIIFTVPPSSNFSLDFGGKFGRYFSTGIVACNSSTGPTKTIGSADCWFDVQYQ